MTKFSEIIFRFKEKEFDLTTVTASLAEIDVFIATINTRKAAL